MQKVTYKGIDVTKPLQEWAEGLIADIREEMKMQNLNASGRLSDSLEYNLTQTGVTIYAWGYFPYAEGGRGPGKVPRNFHNIIEQWIDDKGLHFANPSAAAWGITHNIKHYGSSKYRGSRAKNDVLAAPLRKWGPKLDTIIENELTVYINDVIDF